MGGLPDGWILASVALLLASRRTCRAGPKVSGSERLQQVRLPRRRRADCLMHSGIIQSALRRAHLEATGCFWSRTSPRCGLFANCAGVHVDFHAHRHFDNLRSFPGHSGLPSIMARCLRGVKLKLKPPRK